jgi:acetyl-CoA carboxylase biotin carboxyl carrier protein
VQAAPAPKETGKDKGNPRSAGASITPRNGTISMDLDFVRGLIEAVDQSSIDTLEMHREGLRIRISKSPPPTRVAANGSGHAPAVAQPGAEVAAAPAEAPVEAVPQTKLIEVKSPMVGTFYRAPAPEAPPYIEVGSVVHKGQTLCILEAMKLMNELPSEVDGIVREILAENADPVQYGQVLVRIEPQGST